MPCWCGAGGWVERRFVGWLCVGWHVWPYQLVGWMRVEELALGQMPRGRLDLTLRGLRDVDVWSVMGFMTFKGEVCRFCNA